MRARALCQRILTGRWQSQSDPLLLCSPSSIDRGRAQNPLRVARLTASARFAAQGALEVESRP